MSNFPENRRNLIYHYTREDIFLDYILPGMSLKFGNLKNTNDPKEYLPPIFAYTRWGLNYSAKDVQDKIHNILLDYKALCFTSSERNGMYKPRMWAQYGNMNKGVCLALDKALLLKKAKKTFGSLIKFKKINYLNFEHPRLVLNNAYDNEEVSNYVRDNIDHFLFTKRPDWKQENEVRMVLLAESDNNFICVKDALKGIAVGSLMNDTVLKSIVLNCPTIPVARIAWNNGQGTFSSVYTGIYNFYRSKVKENIQQSLQIMINRTDENIDFESYIGIIQKKINLSAKLKKTLKSLFHIEDEVISFNIEEVENDLRIFDEFIGNLNRKYNGKISI